MAANSTRCTAPAPRAIIRKHRSISKSGRGAKMATVMVHFLSLSPPKIRKEPSSARRPSPSTSRNNLRHALLGFPLLPGHAQLPHQEIHLVGNVIDLLGHGRATRVTGLGVIEQRDRLV